jgi:hypothetical protein
MRQVVIAYEDRIARAAVTAPDSFDPS